MTDKSNTQAAFDVAATLRRAETTLRNYPAWEGLADECKRARAALAAQPTPEPVAQADTWARALEIRMAQGWRLTGDRLPVLYTDTINDQQVMRDDLWLCTTAALQAAPSPVALQGRDEVQRLVDTLRTDARGGRAATVHDLDAAANLIESAARASLPAPDGRGTDSQIEKEREIARHAIVGALAAGYAGAAHPGADHWLAAAHDAGIKIRELEASLPAGGVVEPIGYADPTLLSELAPGKTATIVHKDDAHFGPGSPDDVPVYTAPQPSETQGRRQYRLLQVGIDTIQADDEFLQDDSTTWTKDPGGIWVGSLYNGHPLRAVRRGIPASPQDGGEKA